jgi:nicotinate phosphoribosyltransferase
MNTGIEHNWQRYALFTDLYQLTMLQAYYAAGMLQPAAFELFFRQMPAHRNYVLAAGLNDVLEYLESVHFSEEDLEWIAQSGQFSETFISELASFRFTGEVRAVPEGTVVFEREPLIQVVAPLPEAQLVETLVLNQIHFHSVAASKAARLVMAAEGRKIVDFGSRRAFGTDAALKVARTSYLAGVAGTSNVLAAKMYKIPAFGTMAHSYIQAHENERAAFKAFVREFPRTTLLVDTYDTLDGVNNVIALAQQLGDAFQVQAVRLDSGDLGGLAKAVRQLLDRAGLSQVKIFASSSLNEYKLARLVAEGAPIDAFGVGSDLAVSSDSPQIDFAYKLVEYAGQPRMKSSSDKVTWPGRKQVYRKYRNGAMAQDVITRHDETSDGGPLLQQVMHKGERLSMGRNELEKARGHVASQLSALPKHLHSLDTVEAECAYPVRASRQIQADTEALRDGLKSRL